MAEAVSIQLAASVGDRPGVARPVGQPRAGQVEQQVNHSGEENLTVGRGHPDGGVAALEAGFQIVERHGEEPSVGLLQQRIPQLRHAGQINARPGVGEGEVLPATDGGADPAGTEVGERQHPSSNVADPLRLATVRQYSRCS